MFLFLQYMEPNLYIALSQHEFISVLIQCFKCVFKKHSYGSCQKCITNDLFGCLGWMKCCITMSKSYCCHVSALELYGTPNILSLAPVFVDANFLSMKFITRTIVSPS